MSARATRRVAFYGGSFDPPHQCHVLIATWVLCRGGPVTPGPRQGAEPGVAPKGLGVPFDEVWLVPALGHAFGKALTPFETRCRMLEAAVQHLGPHVKVVPIEGRLPVPSYTVDTLRAIVAESPEVELTLVMGADAYAERLEWKEWPALEALIGGRLLVVGRGGLDAPNEVLELPDLSSTEIRRRVAAAEPYWWMVPEAVRAIIEREGLYIKDTEATP